MRIMILLICTACLFSCQTEQSKEQVNRQDLQEVSESLPVKSVLLYDTIQKWPIDTILTALDDINKVIASIESRKAGYSLWRVQSDSIPDYRYLIQGHWPDQASYDSIHVNPDFRKSLDDNIRIFNETRKWDLYRRYELLE